MEISSADSEETVRIGKKIGSKLKGGEVIELVSDLGGGKTTLVRGIAEGLGSKDRVSSPTFTVSKVYVSESKPSKQIFHYDFYRLSDAGIMQHEIAEALEDKDTVVIVEWAEVVKQVLPEERIFIEISGGEADNDRRLSIKYPSALAYVFAD